MPDVTETEVIKNLKDELLDINEQIQILQAKADGEKRDLTQDEEKQIKLMFDQFTKIEDDIDRRQRIIDQTTKLHSQIIRQTEPQSPQAQNQQIRDADIDTGRQRTEPRQPRIQLIENRGHWGWHSFGEFAAAVRPASRNGGHVDPRLVRDAPTTYSSEGVGADGGFAVPPDFRQAIMEKVMGEMSLLSRTDQMTTSSNTITIPKDETTPWDASGGLQAYWDGEGDQLTQSKVALKEETLRLNKLTALVPVTEELLQDASALDTYLRRRVPEKFDFKLNLAIVQGTGTGQPTGILNSTSLVSVAKDSGQAADTLTMTNLTSMWARMYAPLRGNAIWLMNQDVEPQLLTMGFPTSATAVPVYMPANNISGSPFATLFGRPVIITEACETVGDKGDVILVALNQYLTAVKTTGIRTDVSMHLWFDYDMLAYRFIWRICGQPWWNSAISKRDGSNTLSWAVTLDARA